MSFNLVRFRYKYLFLLFLWTGIGSSCSTTKFVPKENHLLDNVKISSNVQEFKNAGLKSCVKQLPNFKMFGLFKTALFIYNLSGRDSTHFINRFLRKMGEAPVIFDSTLVRKTEIELKKWFVNKGFLDVDVSSEMTLHLKKADVMYYIQENRPYRIKDYTVNIEDSLMKEVIQTEVKGEPPDLHLHSIKKGMLLDRNLLNNERERMSILLQNRGYFAFRRENLVYSADSIATDISLELKLGAPSPAVLKRFYYDNVFIYSDYEPLKYSRWNDYLKRDSILQNGYTVFYRARRPPIHAQTILEHCFIVPKEPYSLLNENLTYQSFSMLDAYNNTHIQFFEKERNDSSLLDCHIIMVPNKSQTVSFSVEGTNTAGNFGVASAIHYIHRNLFSESGVFHFKLKEAYESIGNLSNSYKEFGGEMSVNLPDFILHSSKKSFPFLKQFMTIFSIGYNLQSSPEYDRTLFSGGISLQWKWSKKSGLDVCHSFDLLNIDYVYFPFESNIFLNKLSPDAQYFEYTNRFIAGSAYSYLNNFYDCTRRDRRSFRFCVESAGNALNALNSWLEWKKKDEMNFAQYVKVYMDYSKTKTMDRIYSLAWHLDGGIAVPYGNSVLLPFEKRYCSGGSNGVRAWYIRKLGPGSFVGNDSIIPVYQRSGDIKLDVNLEYRIKCFWKLEMAAFGDAGNIWTIRSYSDQEGGAFLWKNFYKEIAMGYGIGFRLNFDYFLIRLDLGEKLYDPAREDRWVIFHPNFKDHFAWHIAIGYPF